jgi:Ca2+-binding EF-hand superfamily protein
MASESSHTAKVDPLHHLRIPKNRDVLEEQWDKYYASRKLDLPQRFNRDQRAQLRKFFQVMDADGGGTIDVTELEGPLLSTGMVLNHRELDDLMARIATGGGEITFWEFVEAFRPKKPGEELKPGEPDMKKLRYLLATAEHESLAEAFKRDHDEDGLSDAEEPVISLYAQRAEKIVRDRQRECGIKGGSEFWYDRLYKGYKLEPAAGGGSGGGGGGDGHGTMTEQEVQEAREAAERAAAAAALRKDSHLTLNTRIGLHRRRFLMATVMQEKDRYLSKRADLLGAQRAAEHRHDAEEVGRIKTALKKVEAMHAKRVERLEATRIVVSNEREGFREQAEDGSSGGGGGGGGEEKEEEEEEEESEDELMPWEDPGKLQVETKLLEERLPRFNSLLINLQRCVFGCPPSPFHTHAQLPPSPSPLALTHSFRSTLPRL